MAKKILLIEDEADVVKVLSKKLIAAGFEVVTGMDAMVGTQQAHKTNPDLILLDLMMPAGGGVSVLKNLARSTKTSSIPVIVITGSHDKESKRQVEQMEIKAFVQKPYEFELLLAEINRVLADQK